jgi:hypothetical protein
MNETPPSSDPGNPFQAPAPPIRQDAVGEVRAGSPFAAPSGFGNQISRAFNCYLSQWSAWIVPLLLSGLIAIACYLACVLPFLLAQGPLACGLYICAFRNLRGWPVDTSALNRGWDALGSAMLAGFALMLLQAAPLLVFAIIGFAAFAIFATLNGGQPIDPNQAAAWFVILVFGAEIMFMFVMMIWTLWINARTMFVLPLVADRGYDFSTAFAESWRATRVRFWERLLVSFLASLIGMMGMYACYVGVLFTLPLQFLIIAAAYDDEFGIASVPATAAGRDLAGGPASTGAGLR